MKRLSFLCLIACAVPVLGVAFAPAPLPRREEGNVRRLTVGSHVTLEVGGRHNPFRRVIIEAEVCLREGMLEHLLTRKGTKEHEAILTSAADARDIHTALLAAGAEQGAPVRFAPAFAPPRGQAIRIEVEWQEKGQPRRVPAQEWVRDIKAKKSMAEGWVFAGSRLTPDPRNPNRQRYLANDGDMICLANFEGAMLDLPVRSSSDQASLAFEAFTKNIPPVGTRARLILAPSLAVKK